jgi:hypothetical protein
VGHIKLDLVPQDEMPRDVKLGVRMQRESESDARGRRTFGPPCVASWSSWQVQAIPDPIVLGALFTYYVWPASDSVLCDGDCLEWAAQWSGCPGADPSYTLTAGEDCVGAIVEIDDTEGAVSGCTLTLTATLNGSAFGDPVVLGPFGEVPAGWLYSTEDEAYVDEEFILLNYPCDGLWGGSSIILTTPDVGGYNIGDFAWNASQTGAGFDLTEDTDGFGRPRITITQNGSATPEDMCTANETVTIAPTYLGDPAGGPHTVSP